MLQGDAFSPSKDSFSTKQNQQWLITESLHLVLGVFHKSALHVGSCVLVTYNNSTPVLIGAADRSMGMNQHSRLYGRSLWWYQWNMTPTFHSIKGILLYCRLPWWYQWNMTPRLHSDIMNIWFLGWNCQSQTLAWYQRPDDAILWPFLVINSN